MCIEWVVDWVKVIARETIFMCRADGDRWRVGMILEVESTEHADVGGQERWECVNVHLRLLIGVCWRGRRRGAGRRGRSKEKDG